MCVCKCSCPQARHPLTYICKSSSGEYARDSSRGDSGVHALRVTTEPDFLRCIQCPANMQQLPPDVLVRIALLLPQSDKLALAQTSRAAYSLLQPLLFHAIVVDLAKQLLAVDSSVNYRRVYGCPSENPTVIRTLYAFACFCKFIAAHPAHGRLIRALVTAKETPDMPELELRNHLKNVLPTLHRLQILHWFAHVPLDTGFLALLPQPHLLKSLCGNWNPCTTLQFCTFKHIRTLNILNVASAKQLTDVNLQTFANLTSLVVSKRALHSQVVFSMSMQDAPCCTTALSTMVEPISFVEQPQVLSALFCDNVQLRLTKLVFRDIPIEAKDASLLKASGTLAYLRIFSIDNCTEPTFCDDYTTLGSQSFLDIIAPGLISLCSLNIGLVNELGNNDSIYRLIANAPASIEHIGVHLKMLRTTAPIDLKPFFTCIQAHSRTLKYLNLCCDSFEPTASVCPKKNNEYDPESIQELGNLTQLVALKLPLTYSRVADLSPILSRLTLLKVVHLGITDSMCATSKAMCACSESFIYAYYSASSLVPSETLPGQVYSLTLENDENERYVEHALEIKKTSNSVRLVRFDLKSDSKIFECDERIRLLQPELADDFESFVMSETHLPIF